MFWLADRERNARNHQESGDAESEKSAISTGFYFGSRSGGNHLFGAVRTPVDPPADACVLVAPHHAGIVVDYEELVTGIDPKRSQLRTVVFHARGIRPMAGPFQRQFEDFELFGPNRLPQGPDFVDPDGHLTSTAIHRGHRVSGKILVRTSG